MICRGSKQGARRANLRKREKTDGLLGLKTGGREDQPMGKREKQNGLIVIKHRAGMGQPKEKNENKWISRG